MPRIVAAVSELAGAERAWRIRVGDYRVLYEIFRDTQIVEIQRVRPRKDVYRE